MSESGTKSGRGKWAAIVTIVTALLTSFTSVAIALITSGSLDYRLKEETQQHDQKIKQAATGAAVDVLWLKERVQQLEVDLAVEKALRKTEKERLDRVESRLLRRGSRGHTTDASRHVDVGDLMEKAKEEVKKRRPPKPKANADAVQKVVKDYLGDPLK